MTEQRDLGNRYQLVQRINRTALGEVWRAWDRVADRSVAAHLLAPRYSRDFDVVRRFVSERAALTRLHHPNIVAVHDLVVAGATVAMVTDIVAGPSIVRLRGGPLPAGLAAPLMAAAFDALAHAHDNQVLHQGITPDAVLLATIGQPAPAAVRVTGFGLARIVQAETPTATGQLGNPDYTPPELFESGSYTAASDMYAAGVLLYEALAGRRPFAAGSALQTGLRHVHAQPAPLSVDPRLWATLGSLLAKRPADRPTAKEAAAALRAL
ncbi:MAG: serine/threonine protein kinase [Propionibacteriaceae bacterium]|jgi:serine/threonine-protein kinase|nr:serine/threonine protein kinase [Propionibacteriaceae bacterium]